MDKEKQIEEMAKVIKDTWLVDLEGNTYSVCEFLDSVDIESIARELLKHYQPKLPKDSVVLSREEYQKNILKANSDGYSAGKIDGSKETAEKILNFLRKDNGVNAWSIIKYEKFIKEQFGVEIKEDRKC